MAFWRYIGCKIEHLPQEFKNEIVLDASVIKELIKSVPIEEGKIEAVDEDAIVSLLLNENIFPLRLHKMTKREMYLESLKRLIVDKN
jgi:hypothetical protein